MKDRRPDLFQNQDDIHMCHCQDIPDRGYWATPPTSRPIYDPINNVISGLTCKWKSAHSCSMMFGYKICGCGVASNSQLLKTLIWRIEGWKEAYSPPHVGYALTISAMLEPSVKHIVAPRIQHHTTFNGSDGVSFYQCAKLTDEGPPRRSGVLSVIATLEGNPCWPWP